MVNKFLEFSSGQHLLPTRFEIIEVQPSIFMLKTKDSNTELIGALDKWLKKNYLMKESEYSAMLRRRSGPMGQVLSEGMTSDFNVDQMVISETGVGVSGIRDGSAWDDDAIQQLIVGPRPNLEEMIEETD